MKIGYQRKEITVQREITSSLKIHPWVSRLQCLVNKANLSTTIPHKMSKQSLPSLNFKRARSIENAIIEVFGKIPLNFDLINITCCPNKITSIKFGLDLWPVQPNGSCMRHGNIYFGSNKHPSL